jgi:hypothetical protein
MTLRSQTAPTHAAHTRRSPVALAGKTTLLPAAQSERLAQLREKRRRRLFANKSVRHASNLSTELRELLLDRLVAAIDVINPLDVSLPLGHEPG